MFKRLFFNHSGELITLLAACSIGVYLVLNLGASRTVLESEATSRKVLETVFRLEEEALRSDRDGCYVPLSRLQERSPLLGPLKKIPMKTSDSVEYFRDRSYLYLFQLEYRSQRAEDYIAGRKNDIPLGFKALAWPKEHATTGEMAFYIDQTGRFTQSRNRSAQYDGWKYFPPDLKEPAEAKLSEESDKKARWKVVSILR